jgi:hypothetical protein
MEDLIGAIIGFVFHLILGLFGLVFRFLFEAIPEGFEFVLEMFADKSARQPPSQQELAAERRAFESKATPVAESKRPHYVITKRRDK